MSNDDATREVPTRRQYVKYGGALVGGGLLAGCLGGGDANPADSSGNDGTETVDATDDRRHDGADDVSAEQSTPQAYEACIEPTGCLTFERVPETWLAYQGGWVDMAFALGQREGFLTAAPALVPPPFFFEPFGIDPPDPDELTPLWASGWDKEVFYELDPEVVLIDPNYLHGTGWDGAWDRSDTEELQRNVAPFFGNSMLRRREFHDYTLYSLYEGLERLADLFRERERYEALAAVHEEVQARIRASLPPENRRPTVALLNGGSDPATDEFYPMNVRSEGYEMKPYRDLEIRNAFPDSVVERGSADYETLLEVDPEIIIVHWGIGLTDEDGSFDAAAFHERYVAPMEADEVGATLTAVREGSVYPGAFAEQGPLVNLLQTELVARQLYPEEFGAFDPERFPDVPEAEQLFDRERVAAIVRGER